LDTVNTTTRAGAIDIGTVLATEPPSESLTQILARKEPATVYEWVGFWAEEDPPSPKCHEYEYRPAPPVTVARKSTDAPASVGSGLAVAETERAAATVRVVVALTLCPRLSFT